MRIEKINDNQIRCTLTKADLESYQVKLTELAYGTEKARRLFQEMMQQAQIQCGFETENMPLMIEAIPVNMEGIILVITKVEDPEELDTRFSRFAPFKHGTAAPTLEVDGADDILDLFRKIRDAVITKTEESGQKQTDAEQKKDAADEIDLIRLYRFRTLEHVVQAAHGLDGFFTGENSLYKDRQSEEYQLVVHQSSCTPEDFNKVCNILSEYGRSVKFDASGEAFLEEHGEVILRDALQQLRSL